MFLFSFFNLLILISVSVISGIVASDRFFEKSATIVETEIFFAASSLQKEINEQNEIQRNINPELK